MCEGYFRYILLLKAKGRWGQNKVGEEEKKQIVPCLEGKLKELLHASTVDRGKKVEKG